MAALISLDCPHCRTVKAAFSAQSFQPSPPGQSTVFIMLFQCQVCWEGIIAKFQAPHQQVFHQWLQGQSTPHTNMGQISLIRYWPAQVETKAPDHVPDNVTSFYLQGMDNVARKNYDAAGTMFRKSLDTALKHLDPSGKGTLQHRIDNLPATVAITPAMKEWAHEIRELGNDAAHEEDPFTEDEATTLKNFTELFLTYTFTLPGMLAARKTPPAPAPPSA
jgi:hypothetical protein